MKPPSLIEGQKLILASDCNRMEKVVLMKLTLYIGNNEHGWALVKTMARECQIPLRTFQRYLSSLSAKGIVRTKRRRNFTALRSIDWSRLRNQDAPPTAHPSDSRCATSGTPDSPPMAHRDAPSTAHRKNREGTIEKPPKGFSHIVPQPCSHHGGPDGESSLGRDSTGPRWSGGGIQAVEFTAKKDNGDPSRKPLIRRIHEAISKDLIGDEDVQPFAALWCYIARRFQDSSAQKPIENPGALFTRRIQRRDWETSKQDKDEAENLIRRINDTKDLEGKPLREKIAYLVAQWDESEKSKSASGEPS